jgi:pimeloyl-ACP methyl ester carboxylesterase
MPELTDPSAVGAARPLAVSMPDGSLHGTAHGSGPTVLLIHGTAPAIWGDLPAALAAEHRVVAYDRRSFGASRGEPPAGGLSAHAEDAAAMIEAVGGPALVVGWSIGGVIALELAARHPKLVERLVLLEPPLHAKRHPRPAMVSAILRATLLGRIGRERAGARAFLRWALSRRDGGSDLDRLPASWRERVDGDARAIVRELAAGTGEHLNESLLGSIAAPARIFSGRQSSAVFEHAARRAATMVPGAELEPVAGGHAVQLDAGAAVLAAVRATARARRSPL